MDRILKISSNQTGAITNNKNILDFSVPSGMVYDMSRSYINLNASIDTTDTNEVKTTGNGSDAAHPQFEGGRGIANCNLVWSLDGNAAYEVLFKNKDLVRNVHFESSKMGRIEDIRRIDVLNRNLDTLRKDLDEAQTETYNQISKPPRDNECINGGNWSPFRDYNVLSQTPSRNVNSDIRIGLSEILESCNETNFDCERLGECRLHVELNRKAVIGEQTLKAADGIWGETASQFTAGYGVFVRDPASAGENTSIMSNVVYKNIEKEAPYWCGQKITIAVNIAAEGGQKTKERIITEIQDAGGANAGKILISFTDSIGNGAFVAPAAVVGVDCATIVPTFNNAELVLYVKNNPQANEIPNQLVYKTYRTEEDGNPGTNTSYNKQYMLEKDVQTIFYGGHSNDLVLNFDKQINSYRLRENQEDKTDRDVVFKSAVHLDRLVRACANSGIEVKNLSQKSVQVNQRKSRQDNVAHATKNFMIAEASVVQDEPKMLDVKVNNENGLINSILFKEMVKVM